MPQFSATPPDDPRGYALPLVRVPAGRAMTGIVTSDDLVGCPTHFHHGRTVPCEGNDCPAHQEGIPWRWHSWLAAYSPSNDECFLFESTRRVTQVFVTYRKAHGTLRGCHFRGQRRTGARNSRVYLEVKPADIRSMNLPDPPNLIKCLCIIWNIPYTDLTINDQTDGVDRLQTNSNGNGRQDLLRNLEDLPTNESR